MKSIHIFCSVIAALVLVVLSGSLADRYGLPWINSWALMHGIAFLLFPAYAVVVYYLLRPIFLRIRPF